jgi:hypothetical protein
MTQLTSGISKGLRLFLQTIVQEHGVSKGSTWISHVSTRSLESIILALRERSGLARHMRACHAKIILWWAALMMLLNNTEPVSKSPNPCPCFKSRRRCRLKPLRVGGMSRLGSKSNTSLGPSGSCFSRTHSNSSQAWKECTKVCPKFTVVQALQAAALYSCTTVHTAAGPQATSSGSSRVGGGPVRYH